MSTGNEHQAQFRFYEELNDFRPPAQRKTTTTYRFFGTPGIKDPIEALGVPHTEVELIVVNGQSVGFDYRLQNGDRVAVYPVFESLDVTPLVRLRDAPLRATAFVLDVNLGKLARRLRMLGFDSLYRNDYTDAQIADISVATGRVILTRDRRLLYPSRVTHGYWLRATDPDAQVREVLTRFDLSRQVRPFHRCLDCNGFIEPVPKTEIAAQLQPLTKKYYAEFYRCSDCQKVYWQGSHYEHMQRKLGALLERN
ncbi:MAG: Mut7-C ubiquitin/RNAse domain-containing protein [Gammaproteobacteria bacterium]|nr:Mut7-C ubiquitin/RNAse domain-containing protein [Gammaproteobacteria bacterium]